MRHLTFYLIPIFLLFVNEVHANNAALCAAVRGNNFERVQYLLDHGANINEEDAFGRRPIFFANHPEMARLLFARGALIATFRGSDEVHRDSMGRNPLHFLLGHTAPFLLEGAVNEQAIMNQIEQTAYVLMGAHLQEVGAGVLRTRTRLENVVDGYNNLPVTYLFNRPWNFNFIERLELQHWRNYRHLAQVLRDPASETPEDAIFGRSYYFIGPGSF